MKSFHSSIIKLNNQITSSASLWPMRDALSYHMLIKVKKGMS